MTVDTRQLRHYAEMLSLYQAQVDERLPKAKTGDRDMSLNLLAISSGLVRAGLPLPVKLAEWLALGLHGLASGMPAEESFGFKCRGKGRTAKTAIKIRQERFVRAFLVEYLSQTKNIPLSEAFEQVAVAENASAETIKEARDEAHVQAKHVLATSLGMDCRVTEVK